MTKKEENDKKDLICYNAYWQLRNDLYEMCMNVIDDKKIYTDSAISALDSAKTQLIQEQVKWQIENNKDFEELN